MQLEILKWVTAKKYQAKPPKTQPFGAKAFGKSDKTTLRWLGMAGFFINSRGTTLMIDPLLEGFDIPVMIDFPIAAKDVPHLDAVFVTHADNDHFSVSTNVAMSKVTDVYQFNGLCRFFNEELKPYICGTRYWRCF